MHFSHYIGVFVLVFPLPFYYTKILTASLAFFPRKRYTLPTTPKMGKIYN